MAILHGAGQPPWFARLADRIRDRRVPDAIDCAIAAACFAVFTLPVLSGWSWAGPVSGSLTAGGSAPGPGSALAVTLFGALGAAPLILRRRWPLAVVAVLAVLYVAASLAGVRFTPFVSSAGPNFAIAVFTAADRCGRRSSLPVTIAAAAATWAAAGLGLHLHPAQDQDAVQLLVAIPAWVAGDIVRARRTYRERLELELRRQAREREGRARAEERLALSRDVHDVVSHSLSMIAVRSGVARLLIDAQPDEARTALAAIETASRSALDEVRQILRQTRADARSGDTDMPTLGDVPALVSRIRASGLDVTYQCTGRPRGYSLPVELSAYRITQEALTNVVKHAQASSARVDVGHGETELTIAVTDDGQGWPDGPDRPDGQRGGLGLAGMRERAALLGGELTAGTGPGGGFTVVARLPVRDGSQ